MNLADLLLSRLRAQDAAARRFGWQWTDQVTWPFPSWRHWRWPYDQEREQQPHDEGGIR